MLYFVRHGATNWNDNLDENGDKSPKCQGMADIELNQRGIEQAKETAKTIKNIEFDRVICSPLKRCKQTCEIIYGGHIPVEYDERVIERDFGEFEGLTRTEFDFYGFWNSNSKQDFKSAESLQKLKKRAKDFLLDLKKDQDKNILVVSHGGFGCALMSCFYGEPTDGNYLYYEVPNGKPIILDLKGVK